MKIAILGSGGREHAIAIKICKSKKLEKLYCIPGNAGTAKIAKNIELNFLNFKKLLINTEIRKYGSLEEIINGN